MTVSAQTIPQKVQVPLDADNIDRYLQAIRNRVCNHCIDRPPGGPPCQPHNILCGVELYTPLLIEAICEVDSDSITPYVENIRRVVCAQCIRQTQEGRCEHREKKLCPVDYLLPLLVETVVGVDRA